MPAPEDGPAPEERPCVDPGNRGGTPNLRQVVLTATLISAAVKERMGGQP
ncbi:hypothetical protein [Methanoculleus oceani]|nr:hypothetical protein [Methanoculleus sp. CWC-02]